MGMGTGTAWSIDRLCKFDPLSVVKSKANRPKSAEHDTLNASMAGRYAPTVMGEPRDTREGHSGLLTCPHADGPLCLRGFAILSCVAAPSAWGVADLNYPSVACFLQSAVRIPVDFQLA
jgi:hypothetical protein